VAMSLASESDAVVEATGSHLTLRASITLADWHGREAEAMALIEARRQDVLRRGEGLWLAANDWGSAIRYNGLGRYEDALAAAARAAGDPRGLGQSMWVLVELIEAAVRSGHAERATGPLAQLAEMAHAADTDWALGTHARAAALLAEGATAGRAYREAIERLSRTRGSEPLARAHLLYGEWLRREHRRVDAREQLRVAHAMLSDIGMEAFAERARRELLATGETVRKRTVETRDDLTPQELQVAVEQLTGRPTLAFLAGPERIARVGVVTGGGADFLDAAAEAGADAFVTGEAPERSMALAGENAIHLIIAGHYATETFGIKRLGQHLAEHFGLEHSFIDVPNPI
jgi:putative NIF3 family GTP cyclohydrolase 1 type 2